MTVPMPPLIKVPIMYRMPPSVTMEVLHMIEERAWIIPASGRNRTGPIKALEKLCMASITLVFIGFAPHC